MASDSTPLMELSSKGGNMQMAPSLGEPPTTEGNMDNQCRKTRPVSRLSKVSESRAGSEAKRNPVQRPTVVRGWKSIFARSQPTKHKALMGREALRMRKEKPSSPSHVRSNAEGHDSPDTANGASVSTRSVTRLGKADLGRYAHEDSMPRSLRALLEGRGESCNSGIVEILGKLLRIDPSVKIAYLCDSRVQHVAKMTREGSFCGYRNLQMLISYIVGAQTTGAHLFAETYPTILQIQDLIENAWDHGHNSHGRLETGGIRGTRKFIGTPEAQALFSGLGIRCSTQAFRNEQPGQAARTMLTAVFDYFLQKSDAGKDRRVHYTPAAPVYFQHQGHSLTIIGVEHKQDGSHALLVFDPAHRDTSVIKALAGTTAKRLPTSAPRLLRPYRCNFKYLSKYKEFELLFLDPTPSV